MQKPLEIDQELNHAIRAELGERLRIFLWLEKPQRVPERIRQQLDHLAELEQSSVAAPPSITTSNHVGWLGRLSAGRLR